MKRLISFSSAKSRRIYDGLWQYLPCIVVVLTAMMLAGCLKNEFEVRLELSQSITSTYRVSYYASNSKGGRVMEAAIAVVGGKGEMKGVTRYPTVVSLYSGQHSLPSILIFAQRGDEIKITGNENEPLDWQVSGNKVNETLTQWRLTNRNVLEKIINETGENTSDARKELNKAIAVFVEKNQKSAASLILLTTYYDSSLDTKEFRRLYDILDKNDVAEDYPNLTARQDLLTATEIFSSEGEGNILKDIVVKSYLKNIDTLRLNSGKHPTLMYFWRRGDIERREDIDSLKRIAIWRGDSAKMGIADFCLDSDSTSWTYPVQSDSLKKTLRVWVPRGFGDSDLMKMGVGGTPWWIVTDAKGKVVYTGQDREHAFENFRKLKK